MFRLAYLHRPLLRGESGSNFSWKSLCLVLLCSFVMKASATSCPWPCIPAVHCPPVPPVSSDCPHGVVLDYCYCCKICGNGLGEVCGPTTGVCGIGLKCTEPPANLTQSQRNVYRGECILNPMNESATTDIAMTAAPPTRPPCPAKCTKTHCLSRSKALMCNAAEVAYERVPGRGDCQETSCRACYLHVRPTCNNQCGDPPSRACVRDYYICIRRALYGPTDTIWAKKLLLDLKDPRYRTSSGRLICYVPDLATS